MASPNKISATTSLLELSKPGVHLIKTKGSENEKELHQNSEYDLEIRSMVSKSSLVPQNDLSSTFSVRKSVSLGFVNQE